MTLYADKTLTYTPPTVSGYTMRISLPAGIVGGFILIMYFLIIKFMGYHMQSNLRWINFLLITPIVTYTINRYIVTAYSKTYLKALMVSFASCVISYFILGFFMAIYLFYDTEFMTYLYDKSFPELQLTQLSVFLLIMFEGIVGGVIISFVILQFFKDRIRKMA